MHVLSIYISSFEVNKVPNRNKYKEAKSDYCMEVLIITIIFIVGLASGFLGATVGGGGMISLPALLFLGFSPQSAIAINKVGDVGAFISAIRQYWKSKLIDWQMAAPLAIVVIIGSLIGTQIMVRLDTFILEDVIGIVILFFLPFIFLSRKMGINQKNTSKTKKYIGMILYFLLAVEGAIIGAGGAAAILLIMMYFFGYEIIKGYATNTPSELFSALVPAIIYAFHGFVQLLPAIIIFFGMLIGGFIGSNTAITNGNLWVKSLFSIVILISVAKMLVF